MLEGIHRGIVKNNTDDPKRIGRIQVSIPSLGPSDGTNAEFVSSWCVVACPPGGIATYDVGEIVLVAFGAMDDVNDAYILGAIPRIDNVGEPKLPATAKGADDKSTLGDLGMDHTTHIDEEGITVEFTSPQTTYDKDKASPRAEITEKNGLRQEFDPSNGRFRVLTKEGHQVELSAVGTTIKGGNNTISTSGRFMSFTKGNESSEVSYNRFVKIGKTDNYRAAFKKEVIGRHVREVSTEKKTVKFSSEVSVGSLYENVAMNSERDVGFVSSEKAMTMIKTAINSFTTNVIGVTNPAAVAGSAASYLENITAGNRAFSMASGNLDIIFPVIGSSPLAQTRVRIGQGLPNLSPILTGLIGASPVSTEAEIDYHLLRWSFIKTIVYPLFLALTAYAAGITAVYPTAAAAEAELTAAIGALTTLLLDESALLPTGNTLIVASRIASE